MSQPCCNCGVCVENIQQCSKCKVTKYCSKDCQREQWDSHKALCAAICELTSRGDRRTMFQSHLLPSEHRKLVRLVGEKCEVSCKLSGLVTKALWDTGAMVSVVSKNWLRKHFPQLEPRDVSELVERSVDVQTANRKNMPCEGWVELSFQLSSGPVLHVPFLVMQDDIPTPIIGFNVICEVLKEGSVDIISEVMAAMGLNEDKATQTINILQAAGDRPLCDVKVNKRVVIGAGKAVTLRCHAPAGLLDVSTPVLFQPDEAQEWPEELAINDRLLMLKKGVCRKVPVTVVNQSNHNVILFPRTLVGRLELVNSVTPVEVALKSVSAAVSACVKEAVPDARGSVGGGAGQPVNNDPAVAAVETVADESSGSSF